MWSNKKRRLLEVGGSGAARAYESWVCMRMRVRHPLRTKRNGPGYVGLTIDPAWDDFDVFFTDMGDRPEGMTLDRADPSKGYGPENCRWADNKTQSQNRLYCKLNRESTNDIRRRYCAGGVSQQQLATEFGVSQRMISSVVRGRAWSEVA